MNILLVPLPPLPTPMPIQPGQVPSPQELTDFLFNNAPIVALVLGFPIAIRIGLSIAGFTINIIGAAFNESTDKPKREQPVSFFELPDTEPDEVVGFGDDGELVYASEKPKRKNDEVVE